MSFKMQVDIGNRLFGQSPNEIVGCGLSSRKGDRNTYFDDLETVAEKIKKRDGLNPILHADQNTVYASKGFDEERPSCALGYAMPKAYREAVAKKGGPSQRSRAKSNTRGNKRQSRRRKEKESTKSVYKTLTTASDDTYDYVFSGWNPKPAPIKEDSIYTATFTAMDKDAKIVIDATEGITDQDAKIAGSAPMISTDGKTVEYGVYPQTRVHDESLISTLNSLPLDSNNYVLYQNEYYAKAISNVYNNESYAFDDGASIANSS